MWCVWQIKQKNFRCPYSKSLVIGNLKRKHKNQNSVLIEKKQQLQDLMSGKSPEMNVFVQWIGLVWVLQMVSIIKEKLEDMNPINRKYSSGWNVDDKESFSKWWEVVSDIWLWRFSEIWTKCFTNKTCPSFYA